MKLLPHQVEDAAFLAAPRPDPEKPCVRGCFSGMGSGKTRTALEAVRLAIQDQITVHCHRPLTPIIIIGPPISLHMWKAEAESHLYPLKAQLVKTGKTKLDDTANLFIMSYEIATKRVEELKQLGALALICDESHALKSTKAKRTKAILGDDGLCTAVAYTWLLTGTPSVRWNDDLYTFIVRAGADQLRNKAGGLTEDKFRLRYCITQKKTYPGARWPTEVVVGNRNTEELNQMIFNGMAVRRELTDVWESMPPITFNNLQIPMEKSDELKEVLGELKRRKLVDLVQQGRALQQDDREIPLSTMRRVIGKAKVKAAAMEIADRIESGNEPILVGAWHTEVIDNLTKKLQALSILTARLDGRTPSAQKQLLAERFNAGQLDVLVGQIGAMGVSLNLQGGSHIVVVEADWSPAVMDQFYARCHRMGQKNHVHVDIFEADTKLDEAVRVIAQNKKRGHNTLMK